MMVPDYALIGQIMFYAYGFADAQVFKFFKGLALSDAWCCFDGFNGICIEDLTVIAQQLKVLFVRNADMKLYNDTATMEFEVTFITLKPTFKVSITLNPGHAGRAELPDNLAAWFRSAAMIVPDYVLIGMIMFYEYGFADAQVFKFFKGLALSDAWCCFDGFNGIGIEMLSVIAQQLKVLFGRNADMKYYIDIATMEFEGMLITMKPTFNVSIIMSPGHAGRPELLDNLGALLRSFAMM
eukprot:6489187-Amphidinium_carterae.1